MALVAQISFEFGQKNKLFDCNCVDKIKFSRFMLHGKVIGQPMP